MEQTSSLASTLSGNNINILTGLALAGDRGAVSTALGMTLIQGSHLNAKNAINISTGELSVLASRDTSSSSSETQNGHLTIAQTVWGAAGGPTVSASYDRNQTKDKTTTYNNATLTAADINIITAGDTRIEGANLTADNRLNLDVGGDLLLESKQNRASGSNKGFGVSGGFSFGGDSSNNTGKTAATSFNKVGDTSQGVSSVNGGLNASSGRYQNKETVLSSLTGNEVNVNVAGNTNIVGALLASLGADGKDNGKLSLATGSLSFTDLSNTRFNTQQSMGLSTSVGLGQENTANTNESSTSLTVNSSSLTYSNESSYDKSKTLATIGQGTVTIRDAGATDSAETTTAALAGLNRDSSNLTKEFYSVDRQQGNIDLTVDHRLLSEEGRKQIGEDFKRTEILGESIADIVDESVSLTGDSSDNEKNIMEHIGNKQEYFSATKNFVQTPENAELVAAINDPNATAEQLQQAYTSLTNHIAQELGIPKTEAFVLVQEGTMLNTVNGKQIKGAYDNATGEVYIVADNNITASEAVNTLGHEVSHHMDNTRNSGVVKSNVYDANGESYAGIMGEATQDYLGFNYSSNGKGSLDVIQLNNVGSDSVLVSANNQKFNNTEQSNVDYYDEAGHYYTTYYAALKMGIKADDARTLALYSQLPDEVNNLDAISMALRNVAVKVNPFASIDEKVNAQQQMDSIQQSLHSLTGGEAKQAQEMVTKLINETDSFEEKGLLIHLLGDTYAHSKVDGSGMLYGGEGQGGTGHLFDGHAPDQIHQRPKQYAKYVGNLMDVLNSAISEPKSPQELANLTSGTTRELLSSVENAVSNSNVIKRFGSKNQQSKMVFSDFKAGENTIVEVKTTFKVFADKTVGRDNYTVDNLENNHIGPLSLSSIYRGMNQDVYQLTGDAGLYKSIMYKLPIAVDNVKANVNAQRYIFLKPIDIKPIVKPESAGAGN